MINVDPDRLKATTQLCHVLAHECYFEFLTQVGSRNGSCSITPEGTLSDIKKSDAVQYGSGSLAAAAGLSYTEVEISQAVKMCSEAGLIGFPLDSPSQCPLLNLQRILSALLYQIELFGGSIYIMSEKPALEIEETNTLTQDERQLLEVLSSQLAQFVLYALRDKAKRNLADIATAVYKESNGSWASKPSIRDKVNDLSRPGGLLSPSSNGHGRVYSINEQINGQTIQLMSRLFNHFTDD